MARPEWDAIWLQVAKTISQRSLCVRDQVGAVIVTKTNRLVSSGYNGPPAGFDHGGKPCVDWCPRALNAQSSPQHGLMQDYFDCPALHAEANALSVCDRTVREGGTIYVTSGVCFGCAKLVANSGLSTLIVPEHALAQHAYRRSSESYEFLESCGVSVVTR